MRYIVIVIGLLLCVSVNAQRQQLATQSRLSQQTGASVAPRNQQAVAPRNRVQYLKYYMKQDGDSLLLNMDIDMSRMSLQTNRAQILIPVISDEKEAIELPKVMIQGAARNKAFERELELNERSYIEFMNNLPYAIVKPQGRLNYRMSIPYEPWMANAFLEVEEDLCGCGDYSNVARVRVFDAMTKDVIADPLYQVRPMFAYIQPAVEEIKHRQEIGNAYLDFPRGINEILPNFGNNPVELSKIDRMINTIATNPDITVQRIYMVGYASPESSVAFNTELSRARAESLRQYFMRNSSIPSSMFETRTGGEDWNGLRILLEDFPLPLGDKNEFFRIMNTVGDLDARERAFEKVSGGRPYRIIYDELFPKLRRVVCEVNYTVRDFSLEEAKENMAIAPQLLSLNEMYIVANTYQVGSAEFLKVFEIARNEFPQDPVANLNGAAAALSKNNLRDAERFLKLSDPKTPEYANNMGVFYMMSGNYREAERMLKQAENMGVREATNNLRELQKKIANVNNRREAGIDDNVAPAPQSTTDRRRVQ